MSESSTQVVSRKILNSILNSNYDALDHLINEKYKDALNIIGTCGETPAHISIYKHDPIMLETVLKSGFDVNLKNAKGETVLHVAAMLGDLKSLHLIYETGLSDLHLTNNDGFNALNIAGSAFREEDLKVLKLFNNWSVQEDTDDKQIKEIVSGRVQCHTFLKKKLHVDYIARNNRVVQQTTNTSQQRHIKSRIIRGVGGTREYEYTGTLEFPSLAKNDNQPETESKISSFNKSDHTFFESGWGAKVGRRKIMLTIFACEFVNVSVCNGFYKAQSILMCDETSI